MNSFLQRYFLCLAALLAVQCFFSLSYCQEKHYMPKVTTLMSYNIRNATTDDGHTDFADVVSAIQKSGADFVALQELDSVTGRSGGKDVLRELALLSQYYPVYGPSIDYDGGKYGLGILSKQCPLSVRQIPLPGREEARTLLIAEFPDFVLGCTHLSLTREDRMASHRLIAAEARRYSKPFFLAGDFNDVPESEFMSMMQQDFTVLSATGKPTFPARSPKECIDYIVSLNATGASVVLREAQVLDRGRVSDHLPVLVRFQLKTPVEHFLYGKPYLQNPAGDAVSVMFQTRTIVHAWVEYGTDTLRMQRAQMMYGGQTVCHDIEHKVRLEGLEAGKKYYYRICAREILHYAAYNKVFGDTLRTEFYSFCLPPEDKKNFTAIILNDLHQNEETISRFSQVAAGIPHDFVVFNGDCLTEPSSREDAVRMLHQLASAFRAEEVPAYFIRGNHEIRHFYSAGLPSLLDQPGGHTYGAFSWGDTRFVILDCGEDKPDDHWVYYGLNDFTQFRQRQLEFLEAESQSHAFKRARRRVLIHHIPLWGNEDKYHPCTELWTPVLRQCKFDIGICGHNHTYRFLPAGSASNPFPVCIGGGPRSSQATMMVLEKKGKEMFLRVLNTDGAEVDCWEL